MRWGNYPGLSEWALNVITSVLLRERQRRRGGGNVATEAEIGVCGHETRNAGGHQKLGEARDGVSPRVSRGSKALPTP